MDTINNGSSKSQHQMESGSRPEATTNGTSTSSSEEPPVSVEYRIKCHPFFQSHLHHYTWAWFLIPMATFGVSILLWTEPHRFRGLWGLGVTVYLIGVAQLVLLLIGSTLRFIIHKHSLKRSLSTPTEALFFSTVWISLSGLIEGAHVYGRPHPGSALSWCLRVCFWIHLICVVFNATFLYLLLFTGQQLMIPNMTPAWLLPILPVVISGTMAGIIAPTVYPWHAYPMILGGLAMTGMGFTISLIMAAIYFHRLFHAGLPAPNARPGMFIAVGPPSFAAVNFITLAAAIPEGYGYFQAQPQAKLVLETIALFGGIMTWGLGAWLWLISVISVLRGVREMSYHMTWNAFIFPNVGFALATIEIGLRIPSAGVTWVASSGTIVLFAMWIFITLSHLWAVIRGRELI